jgi:hypothetical protein
MTFLKFYDCVECEKIGYNDCIGQNTSNVIKSNGFIYYQTPPSKCISCMNQTPEDSYEIKNAIQRQIQNTVRVPTAQYLSNLGSLTVIGDNANRPTLSTNGVNANQSSDRAILSVQRPIANPRLRPGRLAPGGVGVDVKHNSFDRILARRKAQNIQTDNISIPQHMPLQGNKRQAWSIVNPNSCQCSPRFI